MYFVHSYAAVPTERDVLAATTRFGDQDITAMVWNKRLAPVSFIQKNRPKTAVPY